MSETPSYTGSCHCGTVRFQAQLELTGAAACNCSICSRLGWLLAMVPEGQLTILAGQEALRDYQFGKQRIHHLFCPTCGIHPFSQGAGPDGQTVWAVNVRCLEGVDLESVPVHPYDGRSL